MGFAGCLGSGTTEARLLFVETAFVQGVSVPPRISAPVPAGLVVLSFFVLFLLLKQIPYSCRTLGGEL